MRKQIADDQPQATFVLNHEGQEYVRLTEVMPGGLLAGMWAAADKAVLLPAVEVIAWDDAVAMLPPDPPIE